MITEPGPDDCAIGVAGAVDAGPPGLNAGGGGELQAARPEQISTAQISAVQTSTVRAAVAVGRAVVVVGRAVAVVVGRAVAVVVGRAVAVVVGRAVVVASAVGGAAGSGRFMRLRSSRTGGARR
jgi:hypothetical protein